MTNNKDVNSTEQLLKVIRGSQQPSEPTMTLAEDISPQQKKSDKPSVKFPGILTGKHRINVGVDIGRYNISFAKMTKTFDGRPLLVDQKTLKLSNQISRGSTEFNHWLKTSLTAFAGSLGDCDIWAMIGAAEVNVQRLKIPIVPKKQLEKVIYWTAKKENPIDEKDVVFDYEMQGEINDQGIPKYAVMVYSAPKSAVEKVRNTFASIGVQLTGITIAPFVLQNIFRTQWMAVSEATYASLYIGHDFSRIDIFNKKNLMMTRGIKTGISSMMEAMDESIAEASHNKKINRERVEKILRDLSVNSGKSIEDEDGIQWNESKILDMIAPALERLVRQIERTLEYYATSVGYEKVEKIYISSEQNVFHNVLLHYINDQLDTTSEFLDPFKGKNVSSSGASLPLAERVSLVPAIGLSLSDRQHTPNAIFTYVDKNKESRNKVINRGIFAVFAAALVACFAFLVFQAVEAGRLSDQQMKLKKELSLFHPILSKEKITALAEDLKLRHQLEQQYSSKYKGMALISELSGLTPGNIRLINVRVAIPVAGAQVQKKDASKKEKDAGAQVQKQDASKKEKDEDVVIEGVVLGDRSRQDALLAQYVMKLENSPILQGVALQKSSAVKFKNKEILQFTINAKIG